MTTNKVNVGEISLLQGEALDDPVKERAVRKERLAAAFRIFGRFGFNPGIAGHISVRDPEWADRFWVNRFGQNFCHIRSSDLVLVDQEGNIVQGEGPVNSAAFAIHAAIHEMHPDIVAAAHAHSTYGKAWSTLGELLAPLTQDDCAFYEAHAIYPTYSGVVIDPREGKEIASLLTGRKAVILQNHGLLTVGRSIDEAAWWFIAMEESCKVQLLARSAGKPIELGNEVARLTASQVGSSQEGWTQFQPLFEWIKRLEPDLSE